MRILLGVAEFLRKGWSPEDFLFFYTEIGIQVGSPTGWSMEESTVLREGCSFLQDGITRNHNSHSHIASQYLSFRFFLLRKKADAERISNVFFLLALEIEPRALHMLYSSIKIGLFSYFLEIQKGRFKSVAFIK